MGHLSYRRAIGSIGNQFAASISSSLSRSRHPRASKIYKKNQSKTTAGRSFLDSSFFPYKIIVVVVVVALAAWGEKASLNPKMTRRGFECRVFEASYSIA